MPAQACIQDIPDQLGKSFLDSRLRWNDKGVMKNFPTPQIFCVEPNLFSPSPIPPHFI
jgi:hypothetical protein